MPYRAGVDDPTPPAKIELRSISKSDFELLTPFAYESKEHIVVEVPTHPNDCAGWTDLASVPPLLWGLLPSYGRQLRAALLHDRLCDRVNRDVAGGQEARAAYSCRRWADSTFFEAMRDAGNGSEEDIKKRVGWFRSKLFWAGVSFGRYWKFRKIRSALLTAHVLAGVLSVDLLVRLPPLPWLADMMPWNGLQDASTLVVTWLVAVVGAVVWWRDWQIPFIGLLVGPLILPVLLVTFVVQMMLGLPDQALHVLRSVEQPPGNFGPTVNLVRRPR